MIQFIPEGPLIPEEIQQALRNDSLVFFLWGRYFCK